MKKTKKKKSLIIVVLLLNTYLILFLMVNSSFSRGIELGTQIYKVKHYDEETWNNTVSLSMNPSHWFGGEADIIGAKSKFTIENLFVSDLITSAIFERFLYSNETLFIFPTVRDFGFGEDYINENYTYYYLVLSYTFHYWSFTSSGFDVHPDFYFNISTILQNPQDFKQILDDYNDYAGKINNDTTLQSLNISFPILNGDDLVWQFIINRFAVGNPIKKYLTIFTDNVGCKNVSIQNNKLTFQRHGVKNYNVEIIYNSQGLIENFIVKNSEGYVFYEITSFHPKTIFNIIMGVIVVFVVGMIVVIIIKKIGIQRQFIQNKK